jgi:hypothetical protein
MKYMIIPIHSYVHSKKNRYFTEPVPMGRTFEISYRSTEPKKYSVDYLRNLFRFRRSVRNLKGSSPGHRFGKVPIFLECI